ncbi:MAG: response regulator [Bacteroidota bacterium]
MISIAIIDDEENNRLIIRNILKSRFPLISISVEEGEVQAAIEKINLQRPDLILLDIQLIKGSGFDVINGLEYEPKVVFTTAYSEFALQAIKVKAFDYLLKL